MTEEGWYTFKIALACKDEEFFDVPLEWDTKPEYFNLKSYVKHILNEEIETLQCVKAYVENHLLVNNEIDSVCEILYGTYTIYKRLTICVGRYAGARYIYIFGEVD